MPLTKVTNMFSGLFGPSHNDRYAELMTALADKTVECVKHFNATAGKDLDGVIAFERQGDKLVDQIHEVLDNSFIMRFDISDAMALSDELDNVLDGLRKTAMHQDIYKALLTTEQADARELGAIAEKMIILLRDLVAMLGEPRMRLARVREVVTTIDDLESDADRITALAERRLVAEYSVQTANRLQFLAWKELYAHLEEATDHANHCAKLVLSLARKEA
jgi:uncharacterized protein